MDHSLIEGIIGPPHHSQLQPLEQKNKKDEPYPALDPAERI
jgi:hypothetical protein